MLPVFRQGAVLRVAHGARTEDGVSIPVREAGILGKRLLEKKNMKKIALTLAVLASAQQTLAMADGQAARMGQSMIGISRRTAACCRVDLGMAVTPAFLRDVANTVTSENADRREPIRDMAERIEDARYYSSVDAFRAALACVIAQVNDLAVRAGGEVSAPVDARKPTTPAEAEAWRAVAPFYTERRRIAGIAEKWAVEVEAPNLPSFKDVVADHAVLVTADSAVKAYERDVQAAVRAKKDAARREEAARKAAAAEAAAPMATAAHVDPYDAASASVITSLVGKWDAAVATARAANAAGARIVIENKGYVPTIAECRQIDNLSAFRKTFEAKTARLLKAIEEAAKPAPADPNMERQSALRGRWDAVKASYSGAKPEALDAKRPTTDGLAKAETLIAALEARKSTPPAAPKPAAKPAPKAAPAPVKAIEPVPAAKAEAPTVAPTEGAESLEEAHARVAAFYRTYGREVNKGLKPLETFLMETQGDRAKALLGVYRCENFAVGRVEASKRGTDKTPFTTRKRALDELLNRRPSKPAPAATTPAASVPPVASAAA